MLRRRWNIQVTSKIDRQMWIAEFDETQSFVRNIQALLHAYFQNRKAYDIRETLIRKGAYDNGKVLFVSQRLQAYSCKHRCQRQISHRQTKYNHNFQEGIVKCQRTFFRGVHPSDIKVSNTLLGWKDELPSEKERVWIEDEENKEGKLKEKEKENGIAGIWKLELKK